MHVYASIDIRPIAAIMDTRWGGLQESYIFPADTLYTAVDCGSGITWQTHSEVPLELMSRPGEETIPSSGQYSMDMLMKLAK